MDEIFIGKFDKEKLLGFDEIDFKKITPKELELLKACIECKQHEQKPTLKYNQLTKPYLERLEKILKKLEELK